VGAEETIKVKVVVVGAEAIVQVPLSLNCCEDTVPPAPTAGAVPETFIVKDVGVGTVAIVAFVRLYEETLLPVMLTILPTDRPCIAEVL
jgi:hypothetical protein